MLFISTLRGKIGVVCMLGPVIYIIRYLMAGVDLGTIISYGWLVMLFMILLGGSFILPDVAYLMSDPKAIWQNWGLSLRTYKENDYKRVSFAGYFPRTRCAVTRDPDGRKISTTLLKCTCRDYKKNRRPCIHMHKLAEMLDVHD
ncbi:MAG: SWIM zinc finger family protein [Clostridia bacterium]|nr:SWIM zinc finger family protein [Clostridia bacterium]